jgi:hypothetical protein
MNGWMSQNRCFVACVVVQKKEQKIAFKKKMMGLPSSFKIINQRLAHVRHSVALELVQYSYRFYAGFTKSLKKRTADWWADWADIKTPNLMPVASTRILYDTVCLSFLSSFVFLLHSSRYDVVLPVIEITSCYEYSSLPPSNSNA